MPFHHPFFFYAKHDLRELYVFSAIFSFASSLIVLFEPIFLFQQGFPLSFIGIYYAIHYFLYLFLLPAGGKFASWFGLEKSLTLSLPLFVFYILSLAAIPLYPPLVLISIGFLTLHKIFYWPAFHALFAKSVDGAHEGRELSWMNFLKFGIPIVGPLIGGSIAFMYGFSTLFIFSSVVVLLSAVPLLRTPETIRAMSFPYRKPWQFLLSSTYKRTIHSMIGWGENLIDAVYWPIFLFLVFGSTKQIGFVFSISLACMTLFGFLVGHVIEKHSRKKVLNVSLPFMVLAYLFRPFAVLPIHALFTDILGRLSFAGVTLPATYQIYKDARRAGTLLVGVSFEMVIAITKCITATILAFAFLFLPLHVAFLVAFVLAALLSLFYSMLEKD